MRSNKLLPGFESIKDSDEIIYWTEKPVFTPFLITGLGTTLTAIIIGAVWILISINIDSSEGFSDGFFWLVGLFPIAGGLYGFVDRFLSYGNTYYAFSNKRIMFRTGLVGTNFKIIDLDKVSDIEVTVNLVEALYDVGTIRFFSGGIRAYDESTVKVYDQWESIPIPYETFKKIKGVIVNLKTDYNFSNASRPEVNPV